MHLRIIAALTSLQLLEYCGSAAGSPTEQTPLTHAASDGVQAIRAKLMKAEVIPTVIDDFLPSLTLSVSWEKKKAKLGNTIKPEHLQSRPAISLHDDTSPSIMSDLTYVVTLTDPDAPSRDDPKWSEMCHWIAANISLTERSLSILPHPYVAELDFDTSAGSDDVVEYKPPGPPEKTGKHRYVFLVFAPKNGTTEPLNLSTPKDRQHWGTGKKGGGVRVWAEENDLVPVAANFIYSKNKKQ